MRRFLIGFLAVIGGIALLLVIVTGVGIAWFVNHPTGLPGRMKSSRMS